MQTESWTRHFLVAIALTTLASCSSGGAGPDPSSPPPAPPPPPPPPPAIGVVEVEAVIPGSGGNLAITTAGHPYQGLTLTVPNGSFGGSGTWRVGVDSAATLNGLPAGAELAGPALIVKTDQSRSSRLLTLRIPVRRVAGMTTVLVMRDPARDVIDVPLIVGSDDQSITVAATHFNASLLIGPAIAAVRAGPLSIGQFFPIRLPPGVLSSVSASLFSRLRDAWPAPDAGSGLYPDGHGPGAGILSMLSQYQASASSLGALVKPMGAPGLLADTASFATLLRVAGTFRQLSPSIGTAFADIAAVFGGLTPAARDSLTWLNLRAAMLLTRRAQLVVLQSQLIAGAPPFESSQWSMAFAAADDALSILSSTSPTGATTLTIGPNGWQGPLFRNVLDAPSRPAGSILPVGGSFLLPLESFVGLFKDMATAQAATGAARDQANQTLAADAAMASVQVVWQQSKDAVMALASGFPLIARDDSASIRLDCPTCTGGTADLAVVDTAVRTEVARSEGGGRIRLGGPFGLGGVLGKAQAGVLSGLVGQAFSLVKTQFLTDSAPRMLTPIRLPFMLVPFVLDPARVNLAVGDTARYLTRVAPQTGQSWSIEWNWGDGTPPEIRAGDSAAAHPYAKAGAFLVTATLRVGGSAPLPVAAKATSTVIVNSLVRWKLTSFTGPTTSPMIEGRTKSYVNEIVEEEGYIAGHVLASEAKLGYRAATLTSPEYLELNFKKPGSVVTKAWIAGFASCPGRPGTVAATGSNDNGTFRGFLLYQCVFDQGNLANAHDVGWRELNATKNGREIRGTIRHTIRDYTYDGPNDANYHAITDLVFLYEFVGERTP